MKKALLLTVMLCLVCLLPAEASACLLPAPPLPGKENNLPAKMILSNTGQVQFAGTECGHDE